jgi:glycosyltransferase involved in cell wall biosynthesis
MPRQPRILLIDNFLSSTVGNRGVCEDLAVRLRTRGWQVLTTSDKPSRLPRLWDTLRTIWRRRRSYTIAHVAVYSGMAFRLAEAACFALRRAGKPYLATLHGGNLPPFARKNPERVTRLLRSAVAVTAPSRYLIEQMQPYRSDLRFLPNPLDLAHYPFRLRERPEPRLVWLRAFHRIYNPSLAPRVVARLADRFPEVRLTMIGPDKHDGSLSAMQRVAGDLGVAPRITWLGAVPKWEVPCGLEKGDIFLNTTNIDNTPVSVMEAMACGLCVVSTDVGGLPYLLRHEENALLVPSDDPVAMAHAVGRVLAEPGLAARLSRLARREVEPFDWSVVLPQWDRLLAEVAGGGSPVASEEVLSGAT